MENNATETKIEETKNVEKIETTADGRTIVYVKSDGAQKADEKKEKKFDLKETAIKVGKAAGLIGVGVLGKTLFDHFFGGEEEDD